MPELSPETGDKTEPGLEELRAELAEARRQLAEAREIIRAIQSGDVDAMAVNGPGGRQVYRLRNVDTSYRALVEAMNEGAANLDAEGNVLYSNQTLSDFAGIPLERIVGQSVKRLFSDEFRPVLDDLIVHILKGETATAEAELIGSNGRRQIPVRLSLNRISSDERVAVGMVVTNLTQQKERERQITAERRLLFEILETLPVMACLRTPDHQVRFANRRFRERFGDANGRPCYELCFGQTSPCSSCESFKPLAAGKAHRREVRCPDGSVFEAHHLPFVDFDGLQLILEMNVDVTEQRRTEAELEKHREQLRLLAARIEETREEERARVARDLHDDIGQILTAIKMDLNWVEQQLSSRSDDVRELMRRTMGLIDKGVSTVRRVCSELRPAMLDDLGLAAAIEWHADEFSSRTGIVCEVSVPPAALHLDAAKTTAVFRIFQECLTNVMRHAKAHSVRVSLYRRNGNVFLSVEDDGEGFRESDASGSLGLLGMKERARGCGGELRIASTPGKGTCVTLRMPK